MVSWRLAFGSRPTADLLWDLSCGSHHNSDVLETWAQSCAHACEGFSVVLGLCAPTEVRLKPGAGDTALLGRGGGRKPEGSVLGYQFSTVRALPGRDFAREIGF